MSVLVLAHDHRIGQDLVQYLHARLRLMSSYLLPVSDRTSRGQTESAEQVQEHQNDQDHPHDPDASARTPSPISVIASTAAEQEQQNDN